VRGLLTDEVKSWKSVAVSPGRYTRSLNPTLIDYLQKRIDAITDDDFHVLASELQSHIVAGYSRMFDDHEAWIDDAMQRASVLAADRIVSPLMKAIRAALVRHADDPDDRAFDLETTLISKLIEGLSQTLPGILNTYATTRDDSLIEAALCSALDPAGCRGIVKEAAQEFWTADALSQLHDLMSYIETGENLQAYLYVGTLRYRNHTYPLFYLPIMLSRDGATINLSLEPHIYVNRQALDYVLQDVADNTAVISPIRDRIVYLGPQQVAANVIDAMADTLSVHLGLPRPIRLCGASLEQESTTKIVLRNQLIIAAFDRADEALVNDYEQILTAAQRGGDQVTALFEDIVKAVMAGEPTSLIASVEREWLDSPLINRLIAESPIPLNEEQRKILMALARPDCRFVVVEGPPGTGKSHTISAIAFDAIRTGKSVLVLSDKAEALDVVEDKLERTISAVRPSEEFPNPLLRLGKTGSNYSRLVSLNSAQQIMREHAAAAANEAEIIKSTEAQRASLIKDLKAAIDTVSAKGCADIHRIFALERSLDAVEHGICEAIRMVVEESKVNSFDRFASAIGGAPLEPNAFDAIIHTLCQRSNDPISLKSIMDEARRHAVATCCMDIAPLAMMRRFDAMDERQARFLISIVQEYESLRQPIFGYLFRGRDVRRLEQQLRQRVPVRDVVKLGTDAQGIKVMANAVLQIADATKQHSLKPQDVPIVFEMLCKGVSDPTALGILSRLEQFIVLVESVGGSVATVISNALIKCLGRGDSPSQVLADLMEYAQLWGAIGRRFRHLGKLDYIGKKAQLERLYARAMANGIDKRFVSFVTEHSAESKALARVIKDKAKFPEDRFQLLRTAFPVIIASIRDFSEYMPLLPELFDLVIIDEGSQISVAQAFPALLRAKQVVVFGDHRQFSNVKSSNASSERNKIYRNDLEAFARARISADAATLARLATFDIKRSVIDFFENCANYRIMLRKHFRGYLELIGFSSRYFYQGELQAIKVRNVPIRDTIRFDFVDASRPKDRLRNVNQAEADFIISALENLLENKEPPPTVCVITPFREQQQYINKRVSEHQRSEDFRSKLDLKILTFDTCQGLEREIVIYSMVETSEQRILNYIFPVSMEGIEDSVEEKLKAQRLNVGLSRAQEMIWFVLSKPIADYSGSIGTALRHYENWLNKGDEASVAQTDRRSKMEGKVLGWLQQSSFVQSRQDCIRITPQFPVGQYLRQLDRQYQHPDWKVDFLVTVDTSQGPIQIIVEYDGFEHHFRKDGLSKIDASNYKSFMSEADIERQLTLEQYGYRFVRLNRFNIGRDPVSTVSRMLEAVVTKADASDPEAVARQRADSIGLANGSRKRCTRCNQVRDREDFADPTLKGGYGRICMNCKDRRWTYRRH